MTNSTLAWFTEAKNKAFARIIGSPVHVGEIIPRIGSVVPFGGTVVSVNQEKPEFTIREMIGEQEFRRTVRFSTFRHAVKVQAVRMGHAIGAAIADEIS
jgi:hypothetical protein